MSTTADMKIDVLELGRVSLPDWHPRAADGHASIRGWAIHHPDGVFVVDTGVADDHDLINDLFDPQVVPIVDAINSAGIDERDVVAIINGHLHFDHCGQNRFLPGVPVYAQRAEWEAATLPHFTIAEWALIAPERRRAVDGDEEIAPGLHILSTPGHTPGHQSVMIERGEAHPTLIVGQACYTCAAFIAGEVPLSELHDESWKATADDSLRRLCSLEPHTAHFSHDPTVYRRPV